MSIKGICLVGVVLRFTEYIEEVVPGCLVWTQSSLLDLTFGGLAFFCPWYLFIYVSIFLLLHKIDFYLIFRLTCYADICETLSLCLVTSCFFPCIFWSRVTVFAFPPSVLVLHVFVQQKEPSSDASSPSSPRFAPPSKRTRRQTASEPSSSDTSPSPQTKGQRVSWGIPTYRTRSDRGLVWPHK